MFCENCGSELENGALFCGNCGSKIGSSDTYSNDKKSDSENNDNFYQQEPSVMQEPEINAQVNNEIYGHDTADYAADYSQPSYSGDYYGDLNPHEEPVQNSQPDFYENPYKNQDAYREPKPRKNGLVIGLIVAIVAVVIAVAGVVVWFATDDDNRGRFEDDSDGSSQVDSGEIINETEPGELIAAGDETVEITGNTRILNAYDKGAIFAPEKLYNDADYYVCCSVAALYKESGGYAGGQIAQLDANDVITVKGAMQDSNWVYVYCKELDIYGWIEPSSISPEAVDVTQVKQDKREVSYFADHNCRNAIIKVGVGHNLNLRTVPGSTDDSTIVRLIPNGENVTVIGASVSDAKWYYVCYDSFDYGKLYGFMSADYLKME